MNTQCLLLHVFIPLLRENLSRGLGIKEKFVSFFNFVLSDGVFAIDFSEEVGWCEKLDSKSVHVKQLPINYFTLSSQSKLFPLF